MTTLQAIADRVTTATAMSNRQAVDPLTVLLFVQALAGALQACYVQPVEAADYITANDIPAWRPFKRAARRVAVERKIKAHCAKHGIPLARRDEVIAAVLAECRQASPDVVADLYADVRAAKGAT